MKFLYSFLFTLLFVSTASAQIIKIEEINIKANNKADIELSRNSTNPGASVVFRLAIIDQEGNQFGDITTHGLAYNALNNTLCIDDLDIPSSGTVGFIILDDVDGCYDFSPFCDGLEENCWLSVNGPIDNAFSGIFAESIYIGNDTSNNDYSIQLYNNLWNINQLESCGQPNLAPLPVVISEFNAKYDKNNHQIELFWTTDSESNNKHFEIQYAATDLRQWETIDTVFSKAPEGNSSTKLNYSYTHKDLDIAKKHYYRLKQVDFNQSHSLSDIVEADVDINSFYTISYFPNPSSGHINLKNIDLNEIERIDIISNSGQTLSTLTDIHTLQTIPVSYTPGMYWLIVYLDEHTPLNPMKVIVRH